MWRACMCVMRVVRRVRVFSRVFCWLSHSRGLGVLYLDTLSERDVGGLRPTGSLTARVLGDGGLVPPWVSTVPSSFVSQCQGSRVRSLTGSSQQSPAPWLQLAPSATPWRFPIHMKGMSTSLTRLFGGQRTYQITRSLPLCLVTPLSG